MDEEGLELGGAQGKSQEGAHSMDEKRSVPGLESGFG